MIDASSGLIPFTKRIIKPDKTENLFVRLPIEQLPAMQEWWKSIAARHPWVFEVPGLPFY